MRMKSNPAVKPDWRIVKVGQKSMCNKAWVAEKQIETCGVYYLIDANLHVHICSITPCLEAWPMVGFATFATDEASEADEGEVELAMLNADDPVSYYDLSVLRNPSEPASRFINIPDREEDEEDEKYRARVADEVREYLSGNPCSF